MMARLSFALRMAKDRWKERAWALSLLRIALFGLTTTQMAADRSAAMHLLRTYLSMADGFGRRCTGFL